MVTAAKAPRKIFIPIMTATKQQVVKATLNFSVQFNVLVQATEAKWKRLTKDGQEPDEKWEDQGAWVI